MKAMARPLGPYDIGATPFFALQGDRRFSYCLAVPTDYDTAGKRYSLVVLIHGTDRRPSDYRDAFVQFAADHDCIVLAPLFAAGMTAAHDLDSYKFIGHGGVRYDEVLLAMADEVAGKYRLESRKFLLYGFSGGGQFAHRMFILYPHHLRAVSIGAPGKVTRIDAGRNWWIGTADIRQQFGVEVDVAAMRRVPVQMVIGGQDTETWEITVDQQSQWWMQGANDAGVTRLDRIAALKQNFEAHGIAVQLDVIPGVGHTGRSTFPSVQAFMSRVLKEA